MKWLAAVIGSLVVVWALYGCAQQSPFPWFCVERCTPQPTIPPEGKVCTLKSDTCDNGIRTCVYDCVDKTPDPRPDGGQPDRRRLELEIRSRYRYVPSE